MRLLRIFVFLVCVALPQVASAQSAYQELKDMIKAEVVEVTGTREAFIPGTTASTSVQTVRARLLETDQAGEVVTFENDLIMLEKGDDIFLSHIRRMDGIEFYQLKDVNRQSQLLLLVALFIVLLVMFAGFQGLRALASLAMSIAAILFLLVPALLAGYDPVLVSMGIAGVILAFALFGTHGINPRSTLAFAGTFSAVLVTGVIAWFFCGCYAPFRLWFGRISFAQFCNRRHARFLRTPSRKHHYWCAGRTRRCFDYAGIGSAGA